MRSTSRNSATSRISGWTLLTITIFWIAVICSVFPLVVMLHRAETPSVLQRESAFVTTLLHEKKHINKLQSKPWQTWQSAKLQGQHKSSETNATSEHNEKPQAQPDQNELGSTVGAANKAEVQRIAKPMSQRDQDELGSTVGPADKAEVQQIAKPMLQRDQDELGSTVGPADEAEVQRILNFPHVSECKVCKACIPHSAVAHTPKAQQYASKPSIRDILEQGDVFAEFHEKTRAQSNKHSLSSDSSGSGAQLSDGVSSTGSGTRGTARRLLSGDDDDSRFQIEQLDGIFHLRGHDVNLSNIAPGNHMEHHRVDLQDCPICWGCKHTLEFMASGVVQSGSYYSHEVGGSPSWLFRVRTNKTSSGWAVVKTWCVPVMKVKQRGYSPCSPKRTYAQMKILMAQELVSEDCGFGDIVPELWIEPINGVVPGHGFPVNWLGLWADIAEGASIQNLYEGGHPILAPEKFLNLLKSINHEEVKRGAIFDLLFSQCDRHQENLFFTDSGKMTLIDNDQVYGTAWRRGGVDSILVPSTQKFHINHLSWGYVMKNPPQAPPKEWETALSPLMLLDYRCHVKEGKIGKDIPPKIRQCMEKISGMSKEGVMDHYGYPDIRMADAIRNRSRDILTHGYEWTLYHGLPLNQAMHRYKLTVPCCNASLISGEKRRRNMYKCETPGYSQITDLPWGNAWHGGKWQGRPGQDTGNYDGLLLEYPQL